MALSKLSGDVHSVGAGDWDAASERLARLDLTARRSCRAPRWRPRPVMVLLKLRGKAAGKAWGGYLCGVVWMR